jgi:uncharacterized SAM-binding protein YcdF (DUF218 family)
VFTLSPNPSLEELLKNQGLKRLRNPICGGRVISTIEEAEKIKASLPPGFTPRSILVVTDQWHSRSVLTVWRRVWRDAVILPKIEVFTIPSAEVIDKENPMIAPRRHWTWALVNVLRETLLIYMPWGFELMKKFNIHQPT